MRWSSIVPAPLLSLMFSFELMVSSAQSSKAMGLLWRPLRDPQPIPCQLVVCVQIRAACPCAAALGVERNDARTPAGSMAQPSSKPSACWGQVAVHRRQSSKCESPVQALDCGAPAVPRTCPPALRLRPHCCMCPPPPPTCSFVNRDDIDFASAQHLPPVQVCCMYTEASCICF